MDEREESDDEVTSPQSRFTVRLVGLGAIYVTALLIWAFYLNRLLELSRAGVLSFFDYYYASQNTPMVMVIANGALVLSTIVLTCKELIRRNDTSTTQEQ